MVSCDTGSLAWSMVNSTMTSVHEAWLSSHLVLEPKLYLWVVIGNEQ